MRICAGVLGIFLAVSAALPGHAKKGGAAAVKATASKDTIEIVEAFLKIDTEKLPVEAIPEFLEIDYNTLPAKLQPGYRSKRIELLAIRRLSEGKKKPPLRRLGEEDNLECEERIGDMKLIGSLKQMSFMEINDSELNHLITRTKCSECELQHEFSLTVVFVRASKKGKQPTRHLLLHSNDPLTVLVALYRNGGKPEGTNFFSVAPSAACR